MSTTQPYRPKAMRACARCRQVQTQKASEDGCTLCHSKDITKDFLGMVSVFDSNSSWVAKWHGYPKNGIYAIVVDGKETSNTDKYMYENELHGDDQYYDNTAASTNQNDDDDDDEDDYVDDNLNNEQDYADDD